MHTQRAARGGEVEVDDEMNAANGSQQNNGTIKAHEPLPQVSCAFLLCQVAHTL